MGLTPAQKTSIEEIINALLSATGPRSRRKLADLFVELVDKDDYPEYYEVIPDPKCFNGIRKDLASNAFKDTQHAYDDIKLIFLNALHYNQEDSQIAKDANTLMAMFETEWKQRPSLPTPRQKQQRSDTPDVDIDGSSEAEGMDDNTRDQSDEIVRQLEKGLPTWEGFGSGGWSTSFQEDRYLEILQALKGYKDTAGNRMSIVLDAVPELDIKNSLPFRRPSSLQLIENRVHAKEFTSPQEFDREMHEFFVKARRFYDLGSDQYGSVLLLQRFYQALTSHNPPAGPPYQSTSNWASLPAGPGTAKPLNSDGDSSRGVTMFRVSTKDRKFIEEVQYRGWKIRVADWLHLSNPDDSSKPIVGQVFKCYVSEEPARKGQQGVTVCWYYRPEQTIHPAHRQFWQHEVFKTSHFADHPLDDIIEKIACQFTARHIRGRPRPPFWYPGFPLYVCDSRYNDRERIFVKIKNWNSCVPEEVRKSKDFMPIYPFETSVFPRRFPSPFVGGGTVRGTGGIGDAVERGEGDKLEGGGTGRKKVRKTAPGPTDYGGPNKGVYVGAPAQAQPAPFNVPTATNPAYLQPNPVHAPAYSQPQRSTSTLMHEDRSMLTAAGGLQLLGAQNVLTEKLPPETAKHFDRDPETNEVLWFPTPPVDVAPSVPRLRHSFAYMHWLTRKRKARDEDVMDVDSEIAEQSDTRKKTRVSAGELWERAVAEVGQHTTH